MNENEEAAKALQEYLTSISDKEIQNIDDGDLVIDNKFHVHVSWW